MNLKREIASVCECGIKTLQGVSFYNTTIALNNYSLLSKYFSGEYHSCVCSRYRYDFWEVVSDFLVINSGSTIEIVSGTGRWRSLVT